MAESQSSTSVAAAQQAELFLATGIWVTCSIGMMVFNKLAIEMFKLSCVLVVVQMSFTVLVMLVCCWSSLHIGSWKDVAKWSLVAPMFGGVLLTSMFALEGAPMTLVITFRGLAPIFGLLVEQFFPTPVKVSIPMIMSMLVLLSGIGLYCVDVPAGNGYYSSIGWVLLNNFFIVVDRLLQRLMLAPDQWPVDMSKTAMTLMNNLLGMVPILIAAYWTNEFPAVGAAFGGLSRWGVLWVLLSCFVGVGISYVGLWTQSLINATTFLVVGTVNKFFVILIEVFVMHEKAITPLQSAAAGITILAGVGYGKARELLEYEKTMKQNSEATPLVAAKV